MIWVTTAERWELPSFPQTHQWDGEATLVVGCWEILGPQSPSFWLIHKADVPCEERQAEKTKGYSHTPSPNVQLLKQGWKRGAAGPTPSSMALAGDSTQLRGQQFIPNRLNQKLTSLPGRIRRKIDEKSPPGQNKYQVMTWKAIPKRRPESLHYFKSTISKNKKTKNQDVHRN